MENILILGGTGAMGKEVFGQKVIGFLSCMRYKQKST